MPSYQLTVPSPQLEDAAGLRSHELELDPQQFSGTWALHGTPAELAK